MGKKLLSLLLCFCLVLGVYTPLTAENAEASTVVKTVTGNQNEALIFSYLTEEMGLNSAGACGILANVYRECRFNEKSAGASGLSYGICQWYNGNYQRLLTYCADRGFDYRTLAAQLYFLKYDLESRFSKLLASLKAVPNSSEGAYEAAYLFCYNYERPRNYESASESRGELSQLTFWPVFGNVRLILPLDTPTHIHTYATVVGKATLTTDGSIRKICSICKNVQSTQVIRKIASVKLSGSSFVYNGKTQKPLVVVKDSAGKIISGTNYTVSYMSNSKNVGIYRVTVTFKGNYSGKVAMTYQIVPKNLTLRSVSGKKKSLYVKWSKNTTQTSGYQLQYSTDSAFQGGKAPVITLKNKTTSKTLKKLSAKRRYYVRIRAYTAVKYNGKYCRVFSAWSQVKSAVTR